MGAAMVMIMPPFFGATLTAGGPAVIEYFKQVAGAIHIPVMVQDAPVSPTPLPASLLIDLVRQVPQVQYAKIEVPQAADKLHALAGAPFGAERLAAHMAQDKKAEGGALTFILARAIGEAFVAKGVDPAALAGFLASEGCAP